MSDLPIAVLISGGGTTLRNLIEWRDAGKLPVEFRHVVSSRDGVKGLDYAMEDGIPTSVIGKRSFTDGKAHCDAVFAPLRAAKVELVVMGGYLDHLLIPADFENRVVNIHPSLIPAFSGKGFYGLRVHQAAIDMGVRISGCTVHFVDNEFDHGPIIAQQSCEVRWDDDAKTLQSRIFELERQLLPEVVAAIARGEVTVDGRVVRWVKTGR